MHTLKRLLALWRIYAWLDLVWVVRSFRFFAMYYAGFLIVSLASVAGMLLVAERFDGIGAWSKWQVVFLLGYGALVVGLLEIFFGFNIQFIGRRLGRGQFDHMLIQPQPLWMCLLTDGFNPFGASNVVLPGVAMLAWAWSNLSIDASPQWWLLFALNTVASAAVMLAYNFIWGSLAFWAPRAAEEINTPLNRMFEHLMVFPLDGLSGFALGGLMAAVPVGFAAWLPSRVLLGLDTAPWSALATPAAALAFGAIAVFVFRRGMRHYSRVGSQRYRAMGHRA